MYSAKLQALTLNVHKGFDWLNRKFILHELRDAIHEVNADIVFLQEVLGEHQQFADKYANVWPKHSQYEFLADEIWGSHAYGRNAVYPHGHHGNAILSRYPIDHWFNHDVSLNGIERRGLLYCHINIGSCRLHAICVHLGLRESHRQFQLNELANMINKLPEQDPVMVAGDFNDWRQKAHDVLYRRCQLVEITKESLGRSMRTFPAGFPILRLDRIYVRRNAAFKLNHLSPYPWSTLSDHKPLHAEIEA